MFDDIIAQCKTVKDSDGIHFVNFQTKRELQDFYCYCFNHGIHVMIEKPDPCPKGLTPHFAKIDFNASIELPTL